MKNLTYTIYTLGCKVNQYDSAVLDAYLRGLGLIPADKDAALVVLNTCAVTKTAISKAKSRLNQIRRRHPRAKIVLMGCWVKVYGEDIKDFAVDLVWPVGDLEDLSTKIAKLLNLNFKLSKIVAIYQDKVRYFLKVQDGCEQFCSYCIIPYTRGKLKSRPTDEVLAEAQKAAERYPELVLTGIHLGLYGREKQSPAQTDLAGLAWKILAETEIKRLRLSSIEITEVGDKLIELIKSDHKFCRHLHISLQSGCDKILKSMNRPYTTRQFAERISRIRSLIPDIAISTDVIVGFPGETEADFRETYDFCQKIKFSKLHVFSYSAHEKTKAYSLPGRVSSNKTKDRSIRLRRLGRKLEVEYINTFKSQSLPVLVESIRAGQAIGKTEYYFDVVKEKKDIENLAVGQIIFQNL